MKMFFCVFLLAFMEKIIIFAPQNKNFKRKMDDYHAETCNYMA